MATKEKAAAKKTKDSVQNDKYGTLLKEFPELGKFRNRVLETTQGRFVDIREFINGDTFTGFTRSGIRLDLKMVEKLEKSLPAIKKLLKG